MTYHVTATRWPLGWELDIDGVGVTQSRTLATAEKAVRSYLGMDDCLDAETAEVVISPELDGNLASEAEAAREATRQAEHARDEAAAKARKVARELKATGMSGADVAVVLGVSPQRVSQLVNS
jgi:DNA-directed RNA polymerase specialized sigma subunit